VLVDADVNVLCQLLHRNSRDAESIQSACQRYIDEREDYNEARSLLQLLQKETHCRADEDSDTNSDDLAAKRKRKK